MARFLCFGCSFIHPHKPKKTAQHSVRAMGRRSEEYAQVQSSKQVANTLASVREESTEISGDVKPKSDDMKGEINFNGVVAQQKGILRKSQSLDSAFRTEGRETTDLENTRDEMNNKESCDDSRVLVRSSGGEKHIGENSASHPQKFMYSESVQLGSDEVNLKSIFANGDRHYNSTIVNRETLYTPESGDYSDESKNHSPQYSWKIIKSFSMPVIHSSAGSSDGKDFQIVDMDIHKIQAQEIEKETGSDKCYTEVHNYRNSDHDFNDSCDISNFTKDCTVLVMEKGSTVRNFQDELSVHQGYELPSKEFKVKRIEEWLDSIQNCASLEETSESSHNEAEVKKDKNVLNALSALKIDSKVSPGMEAANKYISTLSTTASSAQLVNLGLIVIPLLRSFASLRVLDLSGNAIVKITANALPHGLHVLNLSKNNISTIDGLRELTRLRVLDLSFNRIIRIGHGLASCSSLKELFLAGNRISEVDGLHRLLKLTVLDLRFNKISTAKCLGHLAANNSLQAVSLEGNPAQRNVGDEQLKKHLHSLIPQLAYYNRQPIRLNTLKDVSDRPIRLGTITSEFDHGLRSDHKSIRRSRSSLSSHKLSSSSSFGARNHSAASLSKMSKGKHRPSIGTDQWHYSGYGTRQLNVKPGSRILRTRSEGALAAP